MQKTEGLPRHIIYKQELIANYKVIHILFLSITVLGSLSLLLNMANNIKNSLFTLSGTIPEIFISVAGLVFLIKFKPLEKVFCHFYDDKFTVSHGQLDHSEEELFFEHITSITYERKLINRNGEEKCYDRICFLYESEPVHLDPTGWPDDFHRLLNHYAQEYNIPLSIDEELQKTYKINA